MTAAEQTPSIILFGGSFNPPHRAHFRIAHAALAAFSPAQMQIIPSGQPWQKPHVAPAEHRLAMLQLAVAEDQTHWRNEHRSDYPISINTLEIERDTSSYTIDTLRVLRESMPNARLIWLLGSDQLANFHTWRDWRDILNHTHIAVAQRAGHELTAAQLSNTTLRDYYQAHHCDVTSDAWREQAHGLFIEFPTPSIAVSSTQIRNAIKNHLPTPEIAKSVQNYIIQHNLYK